MTNTPPATIAAISSRPPMVPPTAPPTRPAVLAAAALFSLMGTFAGGATPVQLTSTSGAVATLTTAAALLVPTRLLSAAAAVEQKAPSGLPAPYANAQFGSPDNNGAVVLAFTLASSAFMLGVPTTASLAVTPSTPLPPHSAAYMLAFVDSGTAITKDTRAEGPLVLCARRRRCRHVFAASTAADDAAASALCCVAGGGATPRADHTLERARSTYDDDEDDAAGAPAADGWVPPCCCCCCSAAARSSRPLLPAPGHATPAAPHTYALYASPACTVTLSLTPSPLAMAVITTLPTLTLPAHASAARSERMTPTSIATSKSSPPR